MYIIRSLQSHVVKKYVMNLELSLFTKNFEKPFLDFFSSVAGIEINLSIKRKTKIIKTKTYWCVFIYINENTRVIQELARRIVNLVVQA